MKRFVLPIVLVATQAVAAEAPKDGEFYPKTDLQSYKSFYDPTYWVDSVVATGVGARVTMRADSGVRFVLDKDGWTVGNIYHDKGDFYLHSDKDNAGTAWLHLNAGPGGVSELNYAGGGWKALYKTCYFSPTRFLGPDTLMEVGK